MNELHFAYKVRQHLNRGLHDLRPVARQSVLATAGHFAQHYYDSLRIKQVFAAFILLLCLAFAAFWVADQRVTELGDIDSALLADDLPISAFTDKGFNAWLKRGALE